MKSLKVIIPIILVAVAIGLLVRKLVDHTGEFRNAVYSGNIALVEGLLKAHSSLVDGNTMDNPWGGRRANKFWTPLHAAAFAGNVEMVKLLLRYHAKVDARDKSGMTPLLWTTMGGKSEVAAVLLSNGADINAHDRSGRTTLELAKIAREDNLIELLRQRGAKE